jgi:hypothetical protein
VSRKDLLILLIVLVVGGYCGYGAMTDTGLVSVFDYLQQAIFGAYSVKISFILAVGMIAAVAGLVWDLVGKLVKKTSPGVTRQILFGPRIPADNEKPQPAQETRILLFVPVLFVVLTWSVGLGIYWWNAHQENEDATAHYEEIDLDSSAGTLSQNTSHVAIHGRVVTEITLTHQIGYENSARIDYILAPVVNFAWTGDKPVEFAIKLDSSSPFYQRAITNGPSERNDAQTADSVLLARVVSSIPFSVLQHFKDAWVHFSNPSYLLVPVATQNGKPVMVNQDDNRLVMLILCSIVSVIVILIFGLSWLIQRKRLRQLNVTPS